MLLKLLKYVVAVVIVIGVYNYLKKEGAFTKSPDTIASASMTAHASENEEDELVWPDLEEPKVKMTLDSGIKAKKVLEYLFSDKLQDKNIRCHIKKAKKRTFIGCTKGMLVKDNYWELSDKEGQLQLLTRNDTALYLAKKYTYKELVVDEAHISEKVEKAFVKFFTH